MSEDLTFNEEMATEYDKGVRRTLPTYDGLFRLTKAFLQNHLSDHDRLLVVGGGGGNELTAFSANHLEWRFTIVDPSEAMLSIAKSKAERLGITERTEFIAGTVSDLTAENKYDGATCLLVLHFISEQSEKIDLLKKIRASLPAGAPFVLATMYGDENDASFQDLFNLWKAYWIDSTKLTEAEVEEMESSVRSLSFLPANEIEALLKETGFHRITQFFQTNMFGAWICFAE